MSIRLEDLDSMDWADVIAGTDRMPPNHPGGHLAELLTEYGLSQYRLAKAIGVSPRRINEIVQGKRAISADTALRLGKYFGMSAEFWLNLQQHYDLEQARITARNALNRIEPRAA